MYHALNFLTSGKNKKIEQLKLKIHFLHADSSRSNFRNSIIFRNISSLYFTKFISFPFFELFTELNFQPIYLCRVLKFQKRRIRN